MPPPCPPPPSVPAVLLHHVRHLDDELPLLVLLAALERLFLGQGTWREPPPRPQGCPGMGLGSLRCCLQSAQHAAHSEGWGCPTGWAQGAPGGARSVGAGSPRRCLWRGGGARGGGGFQARGHSRISSPGWSCSSGRRYRPPSAAPSAAAAAPPARSPRSPCAESGAGTDPARTPVPPRCPVPPVLTRS